jgi:hypothetical protein
MMENKEKIKEIYKDEHFLAAKKERNPSQP